MQMKKVSEEPHHVMGGLGWAGVGWGWDGVGWGGSGMGWGGLGRVGDRMGWCEAILDISQGFKEGRR